MQPGTRIVFAAIGIAIFCQIVYALRTGELILNHRTRGANPVYFWWTVIVGSVVAAAFAFLALAG